MKHDYDGELTKEIFQADYGGVLSALLVKLQERVRKYYEEPCLQETMTFTQRVDRCERVMYIFI